MKTSIKSLLSALSIYMLTGNAIAQQAPLAANQQPVQAQATTSRPTCPCDFNAAALVQKVNAMSKVSKSCMVTNMVSDDKANKQNNVTVSGVTLMIYDQSPKTVPKPPQQPQDKSVKSIMAEAEANMTTWLLSYTPDEPSSAMKASGSMASSMMQNLASGRVCSTEGILSGKGIKQLKSHDEYLVCLTNVLKAAEAINMTCVPIVNFPNPVTRSAPQQPSTPPTKANKVAAVVSYLTSSKTNEQVESTLMQVEAIRASADSLASTKTPESYMGITIEAIKELMPNYDVTSVWGGKITFTPTTATTFRIALEAIPEQVCEQVKSRINASKKYSAPGNCSPALVINYDASK